MEAPWAGILSRIFPQACKLRMCVQGGGGVYVHTEIEQGAQRELERAWPIFNLGLSACI